MTNTLTTTAEPVAELRTYYRNPRKGNVAAIRESLAVNGQYRPLVANRGTHTGRPNEVLAGNHTLIAARDEGWSTIQVCWLDVDDDHAARIVAADNRTSDLAEYDDEMLVALLRELDGGAEGTGYTPDDVDDLAAALEEQAASMPELADGERGLPDFAVAERSEEDRTITGKNREHKISEYTDRDVRSVYLTFSVAEFEWAVPRLATLGESFGVETNTEVVLQLIGQATGDELPS